MATKLYLHDAASPNTGTMPGAGDAFVSGYDATGDATGARTARDATTVIGAANPDIESSITATANQVAQSWGHRRFVTRPLDVQTLNLTDVWTFSYARSESNLNHNMAIWCTVFGWRPGTGLLTGWGIDHFTGTEPTVAATEQAQSVTASPTGIADYSVQAGDVLVIEVSSQFQQSKSSALTDQFAYDGTTEASTTTCASFVSSPTTLIFQGAAAAASLVAPSRRLLQQRLIRSPVAVYMNALRPGWRPRRSGLLVPECSGARI